MQWGLRLRLTNLVPEDETDRLETLAVVYSLPDAMVMQTTLRAYGIPCCTSCANHASLNWYTIMALGGIAVYVPSSMKVLAKSLIPDLANPRPRDEITADIRANGGPYARKRLILAHLTGPIRDILLNPLFLLYLLLYASEDGIAGFFISLVSFGIMLFQSFLFPFFGFVAF